MNVNLKKLDIICKNDSSIFNYFAWPTVTGLQDGRLAMVASGYRIAHICPFGKCVISYSDDEGETWSLPTPVIDTPLDDRDGGICTFGSSGVIVTSFNNSVAFQRNSAKNAVGEHAKNSLEQNLINSYLDIVEKKFDENKYLGSGFVISSDCGKTFGDIKRIPVSSPHGPTALSDGKLLYVGRTFSAADASTEIESFIIDADGSFQKIGEIKNDTGLTFCEPHAIQTSSGKIIVHIRVQGKGRDKKFFTIFQAESYDNGKNFTKPHQILEDCGGAPSHIIKTRDGMLIAAYGHREQPYGIKVMFSHDEGQTWDTDNVLCDGFCSGDLGYPSSVELKSGEILTVFYAHESNEEPAKIYRAIWNYRG